jgi:hypothetical protein
MARGGLPADRLAPSLENVAVAEAEAQAERCAAGPTLPWRDEYSKEAYGAGCQR